MVGHTGSLGLPLIKAAETVDHCVERVVGAALDSGYTVFLTADHGNADLHGQQGRYSPNTAHTMNPVPFFIIDKELEGRHPGRQARGPGAYHPDNDGISNSARNDGRNPYLIHA
jgi:2,3-bisphosphoglycerate-independent phosphoglycerate mutase